MMRSALLAGGLLSFALSFDEIIVTTFTAGAGVTTLPIWIFHGDADDYTPIAPCRQFVERLRAAGKANVSMVSYPGVAHSFDNPRAAPGGFMRTFENYANCFVDESKHLSNVADYVRSCRRHGATVAYDAKATADAIARMKQLIRALE